MYAMVNVNDAEACRLVLSLKMSCTTPELGEAAVGVHENTVVKGAAPELADRAAPAGSPPLLVTEMEAPASGSVATKVTCGREGRGRGGSAPR